MRLRAISAMPCIILLIHLLVSDGIYLLSGKEEQLTLADLERFTDVKINHN